MRCFRDEDLRADRQPEFTQIDVEMSFARPDLVFDLIEPLMRDVFAVIGREVAAPFRRMPYAEAIARYGSDKPDLRCGMEIRDLSHARSPSRRSRRSATRVAAGGVVRGFVVPGGARYSRKQLDELAEQARQLGAAGLVWVAHGGGRRCRARRSRRPVEPALRRALERGAGRARATCCCWPPGRPRRDVEGARAAAARRRAAKRACSQPDEFAFTWVVDFPLLEWDADEQRFVAMHHPFTSPVPEDVDRLEQRPGRASGPRPTTSC